MEGGKKKKNHKPTTNTHASVSCMMEIVHDYELVMHAFLVAI